MINPNVVEGQIAGGTVQGIGGALFELLVYDADGNPLATTFMDYLLPTSTDVPVIEYGHVETPAPGPGGFKGVGEGGAIGAPPSSSRNTASQASARCSVTSAGLHPPFDRGRLHSSGAIPRANTRYRSRAARCSRTALSRPFARAGR